MTAYLDSKAYARFKRDFNVFLNTPFAGAKQVGGSEPEPQLVRQIAPVLIYTRLASVRAFETHLEDAPIERLHMLRIEFKKLRYTVEYFQEVLGKRCLRSDRDPEDPAGPPRGPERRPGGDPDCGGLHRRQRAGHAGGSNFRAREPRRGGQLSGIPACRAPPAGDHIPRDLVGSLRPETLPQAAGSICGAALNQVRDFPQLIDWDSPVTGPGRGRGRSPRGR